MIKNRLLLAFAVVVIIYISLNFSPVIRQKLLVFPMRIKTYILDTVTDIHHQINAFYAQKEKILLLEKELEIAQKNAALSVAFASRLNHFLEENKLEEYHPYLTLVRGLSYVKLGDFGRLWLDFPGFDPDKIYGLLYKGYAAGIVDNEDGYPMARLLSDEKMVFSVAVGEKKHLGVAFGGKHFLSVKYIPTYAEIKVGDEVITSGDDNIFYEGIKVGEVVKIEVYNLYKMAVVEPYAQLHDPEFFYAVDAHAHPIKEHNKTAVGDALK